MKTLAEQIEQHREKMRKAVGELLQNQVDVLLSETGLSVSKIEAEFIKHKTCGQAVSDRVVLISLDIVTEL